MSHLKITPDEDCNIWEHNPHLLLISVFKELKKKEGIKKSSNIIKSIYYIWDPKSDLKDSGASEKELIEEITNSLLSKNFDWTKYDHIKEAYFKYCITEIESEHLRRGREVKKFGDFIEGWKWSSDDAKDKGTVMKQYKDIFKDWIESDAEFKQEKTSIEELGGGYVMSFLEEQG